MQEDIFIGVDGGGSKTRVVCQTLLGEEIGCAQAGPSNIRTDVDGAYQSVIDGINSALSGAGLAMGDDRYRYHIGLGLAGTEVSLCQDVFLAKLTQFESSVLASDAYVACLGAHAGKSGAVIIAGTGVVGYQIDRGVVSRVAGWGFPHADEGGGAWLGLEAIRATFQWIDGRRSVSPLFESVFEFFDNDAQAMSTWANQAKPKDFAELAPYVMLHLGKEEPFATQLIQQAAQYINAVGEALLGHQTSKKPLPLCLMGGVAPFLEPFLNEKLLKRIVKPKQSATQGAILMIRKYILDKTGQP